MSHPPSRVRDRTVADGERLATVPDGATEPAPVAARTKETTADVVCWTAVGASPGHDAREPRATLLAAPATPGEMDGVVHTLVLEVDGPTASVELDYRALDSTVVPERGVRVRTDDDRPVAVEDAVADDGTFAVTFADPPTEGALFLEYSVTRNPEGGRHAVGVVVDGERETEARLVVVG